VSRKNHVGTKPCSSKARNGQIKGSVKVIPIEDEVTLDLPGITDLMKAAYELDKETVELAMLMDQQPEQVDSKGNNAWRYLFAGYNHKMCRFRNMHPGSDIINREKMSKIDREEYDGLTQNLAYILELFGSISKSTL
jgi:hypothetical protein